MSSTDHLSEFESLRAPVADLIRAIGERDRLMQDLREQPNSCAPSSRAQCPKQGVSSSARSSLT